MALLFQNFSFKASMSTFAKDEQVKHHFVSRSFKLVKDTDLQLKLYPEKWHKVFAIKTAKSPTLTSPHGFWRYWHIHALLIGRAIMNLTAENDDADLTPQANFCPPIYSWKALEALRTSATLQATQIHGSLQKYEACDEPSTSRIPAWKPVSLTVRTGCAFPSLCPTVPVIEDLDIGCPETHPLLCQSLHVMSGVRKAEREREKTNDAERRYHASN